MYNMIPVLVPDLPTTEQLLPWLQHLDRNKWYSNFGPLVQEFESRLLEFIGADVSLATVSSGTAALELALRALNLPDGAKVLLPAFTFPATVTAIKAVGLVPVFTDIDPHQWSLNTEIARNVLKWISYDVVVPVATYGCPQAVEEWDSFSNDTGIPVVIDAAAAFGCQTVGEKCIITFSFHATKPFGIGEGGLVVAPSPDFIAQIQKLSNFGFDDGVIIQYGSNAKLSEYHAAVGLAQLERWSIIVQRRQDVWLNYLKTLGDTIQLQRISSDIIPAVLAIKINDTNDVSLLIDKLAQLGIETRSWYCPPLYQHPAFLDVRRIAADGSDNLSVTDELSKYLLGLPFHGSLKIDQINYICKQLKNLL